MELIKMLMTNRLVPIIQKKIISKKIFITLQPKVHNFLPLPS